MPSTIRYINVGLRVPLFMFIVIALGITGHLNSIWAASRINAGLAASVICLVFSVFFPMVWLFLDSVYNSIPLLVLDFISFALVLSASAALTESRGEYCWAIGHCGEIRAAVAFLYMSWIILLFIYILQIYEIITAGPSGGSSGSGFGGGLSTGGNRFNTGMYNKEATGAAGLGSTTVPVTAEPSFPAPAAPQAADSHLQTTVDGTIPKQDV